MNNDVLEYVAAVSTSAQWSTLGAVAKKACQRQGVPCTVDRMRGIVNELNSVDQKTLATSYGVWVHSFGSAYQPLVLVNPAYRRAYHEFVVAHQGGEGSETDGLPCTCQGGKRGSVDKYFTSSDYNAGKHRLENSGHMMNCLQWCPPTTGHLHSWRRGYEQ